ncbi:eCIS core domain-containing protein [Polyangium mundeleinium]|uniref:DUF4157 domain-containing protein n=1 Tax=Polyangium mundeleinium TaxID=2995306 RepID=A0ABT5EIK1_9BACT|nr:DUF4157 domain-containing protein [Polyangium mundeleinium]MDC0741018.1 DUF4157 domain-containing protein [Polyangium mundeleinium]
MAMFGGRQRAPQPLGPISKPTPKKSASATKTTPWAAHGSSWSRLKSSGSDHREQVDPLLAPWRRSLLDVPLSPPVEATRALPSAARSASRSSSSEEQAADAAARSIVMGARPELAAAPKGSEPGGEVEKAPPSPQTTQGSADILDRISTRGAALPAYARQYMEQRFGHDFSRVRVVADRGADQIAGGLGARAFTLGENIVFARDEFRPDTEGGRLLLAHELAHVVQQRESGRAHVALQPAQKKLSLLDQVRDLRGKLYTAGSEKERKPHVVTAMQLADNLIAVLTAAKGQKPPNGALIDETRELLIELVRGLANNGEPKAAWKIAVKSEDRIVENAIFIALRNSSDGVAGQQSTFERVAPVVGQKITPNPDPRRWLDTHTPAIGKTLQALDKRGLEGDESSTKDSSTGFEGKEHEIALEMTQELLEQYFTYAHEDVRPNPLGKVGHLNVDEKKQKLEADCDIYATYGARLLREQGWETAGYLAIVPGETKHDNPNELREAHMAALMRKKNADGGWHYVGISNAVVRDLSIFSSDENVRPFFLRLALTAYDPKHPLTKFKAYYLPPGPGGALDMKLLDPQANGLKHFEDRSP